MRKTITMLMSFAVAAATPVAASAQNIFMEVDGIMGDARQEAFVGQIELDSLDFTVSSVTDGGKKADVCRENALSISKTIDMSTADLISAAARGAALGDVVISFIRDNGESFFTTMELTLVDTFVSSYSTAFGEGGVGIENLGLSYSNITGRVGIVDDTGRQTFEPFDINCF